MITHKNAASAKKRVASSDFREVSRMNQVGISSASYPTRADLRRRKLIETARALFVERGFHATGVAQIARESGIAVGQMYRDFASKEDIVTALVAEDCAAFLRVEALNSAISNGSPEEALAWILDLLESEDDLEGKRLFAEIVAESARNERIASIFKSVQGALRGSIVAALEQLAPDASLERHREQLADTIVTFSLGLLHHQLMIPDLDVEPVIETMRDFIRDRVKQLASM